MACNNKEFSYQPAEFVKTFFEAAGRADLLERAEKRGLATYSHVIALNSAEPEITADFTSDDWARWTESIADMERFCDFYSGRIESVKSSVVRVPSAGSRSPYSPTEYSPSSPSYSPSYTPAGEEEPTEYSPSSPAYFQVNTSQEELYPPPSSPCSPVCYRSGTPPPPPQPPTWPFEQYLDAMIDADETDSVGETKTNPICI